LEIIKTIRSKDFSFGFTENVSKFMILRKDIGKVRSLYKFCRVDLNVQRVKIELKLARAQSFNAYMNVAAPMITMLDCSEVDIEISDAGIETIESDDCKEVSENDRDVNGMLATMQEGARFSCKDRWKFINLFIQSISRLCQMSQLYPRTKKQEESSKIT